MGCKQNHRDSNFRDMNYSVDESGTYIASCKHCDYVINIPDPIELLMKYASATHRNVTDGKLSICA